ncbi:MAG: phosphatidate cytidylyltransferase [Taibaiella sp.]|jgi:phosphatidate cytidylyltransferase
MIRKLKRLAYTNLKARAGTSLVLVLVIVLALFSGPWSLLLLVLTISVLATSEYHRLILHLGYTPQRFIGQTTGLLLIIAVWSILTRYNTISILAALIPIPALICFLELFRKKLTPVPNIALTLLGVMWISLPLAAFLCTGFIQAGILVYHPFIYLGYFLLLWSGDSGAYFAGMLAGKHPLLKRISPKKTIEGSAGGLIMVLLVAFINAMLFGDLTLNQWLVLALIINLTGTLGDLAKSMLKRSAGVKDSGTLLPGHGGILDRFDSLIGSAPFVFLYLFLYA